MPRIFLSPPDVGPDERHLLLDALDSGWVAPLGPHVDGLERELAERCGVPAAAAMSSGTAALHLALLLAGVGPGDEVLVPTLTFVASVNPITYLGATPVLIDATAATWQVDPDLVAEAVTERAVAGRPPAAVVTVDLYGSCADADPIAAACAEHGVPVIEDAAEAIGATYRGRPAGSLGELAVLSFNGNKLLTTGGGGALLGHDEARVARGRWLAAQAREPAAHYEHAELGFNYRMSNLNAAVGRAQLARLDELLAARAAVHARYRDGLGDVAGLDFMPDAPGVVPNRWLTVVTLDPEGFGATPEEVRLRLEADDVEARPAWKPMHLQPLLRHAPRLGGAVAEDVFARGLCLPSGSALAPSDQDRIIDAVRGCAR